ncbi:response regulator [Methylomarinum sp. Ch1-1]|uniref:Response regulator n=1 Tax=Methylomarinum roseum TaxID=3067653 RepID=A0AAU7NXU2_9GAMM|nr:response regulator [Methylomarinum sp. Ch1-1]MDP4522086.1 response regulator [Methylomarinum sp. Ch1-1]
MDRKEFTDLKVYLVEPSHTQQLIIKQHLGEFGIADIVTLTSGAHTLDSLPHNQPDLIISAMYLPDMTGVDLVHAIREEEASYDMAFLLISSETNIKYLEPIRQAGAIGILPKPFSPQELDIALSATLDYLNPSKVELDHFDIEDLNVLLVDDSQLSQHFIIRILNDLGIELVTTAENGKQAINILRQRYFDLIITDLNMPEMDGLELTRHIRHQPGQQLTPVLMVTSEQNQNRLAAVEKEGVSAVLDKPFEPSGIKKLILQLLN